MAALLSLERKCFSKPWSHEQFLAVFKQSHFFALGLWKNISQDTENILDIYTSEQRVFEQYLVGYISFYHMLDEMEILNIAVDPQFRELGLGKYILGKTLEKTAEQGIHKVILEVRVGNVIARNLYEKFSFECVGKRLKYYTDTGEDACIYALDL